MNRRSWLVSVALMAALAGSAAADFQLPLTVTEPAGVERVNEAASGGIPLPIGMFKDGQAFALFDGDKEVPVQVWPMVVDAEKNLRWILVDFQVSMPAKGSKTFTLKAVKATAAPASPLKVTDGADGVVVDTGKAVLTFSKTKPFALFDSVAAGGKPVTNGGQVTYADGFDGKQYVADKPTSVVVEYQGLMRATVCVKGRFVGDDDTKIGYIARVTAWAGRSDVHVKYILANSNEEHYTFRQIKDSTIRLKLAGEASATVIGADKPVDAGGEAWINQTSRVVKAAVHGEDKLGSAGWLHATPGAKEAGGAKAVSGGKDVWVSPGKGEKAEGWLLAKTANGGVWANDVYFVEDPPRQIGVAGGALVLSGVAEPMEGAKTPFPAKYRWLVDSSHLSSQYVLDFAPPADGLSARHNAANNRLWVLADPAWYFASGQFPTGTFGTQADEIACYKLWDWKFDDKEIPHKAGPVMAACPRWSGGDDNHYTSEQDTTDAMLLMYLRTGQHAFFEGAEAWANYFMDLQTWRTDGWRYKDGGVWWTAGGPLGSSPQRLKDPVTGLRNGVPGPWGKEYKAPFTKESATDLWFMADAKECYCHNWGEGLVEYYMLTGDRDAYEAAIDAVEQNYDTQKRAFKKTPGKASGYSRDFTRSSYLTNAARLIAPTDPFVVEASDYLAACFLQRPDKEPRGFMNSADPLNKHYDWPRAAKPKSAPADWDEQQETAKVVEKWFAGFVGQQGLAEMKKLGVTIDYKTGQLTDPKSEAKWFPIVEPHTWMFPPESRAMELYYRETGNEDAMDWVIAFGQAAAYVLYQPKHGNLSYGRFLADFPQKGVCKDVASWQLPDDCKNGEGNDTVTGKPVGINGYLAQFYPDLPARAYMYCGEPFLKQRAYDFWYYGSHRGYNAAKMHKIGGVGLWANVQTTHSESVCFSGKTFYEFAHPRTDTEAPAAVADLAVTVSGDKATVSFTAPADKGGKVARYQVKCADKTIVNYEAFLKDFATNKDATVCNWWMASNVKGEAAPGAAGQKVSFEVTGVPAGDGKKFFAVVSFDDSNNRSALSNVAEAK